MMKKLKGFTLVEILIVIVIIGILIGALVPRMQSAQGRARDVARKNDLSQLQSAIVTSYSDRGEWPQTDSGCELNNSTTTGYGCEITNSNELGTALIAAGLNGVPTDPIKGNAVRFKTGSDDYELNDGYGYIIAMKNGVKKAGFVLLAHTEVEGGSNWVECGGSNTMEHGYLSDGDDLKDVLPCTKLTSTGAGGCQVNTGDECYYENTTQLRYMLVY